MYQVASGHVTDRQADLALRWVVFSNCFTLSNLPQLSDILKDANCNN